jgi:CIC family chloride channel protein
MSAFFSGATHAPITSIIILFEMTGDYRIILPLMLTTVISTLVSRIISRESIYTLKLTRRGIHLEYGQDTDLMQAVTVGEIMTTDVDTVNLEMPLSELAEEFVRTNHHGFPIVNDSRELIGIISIQDLKRAIADGPICDKIVGDIATLHSVQIAYPDEPMGKALRRMAIRNIGRLPVVKSPDSKLLVGVIRRGDIVKAYDYAIIKRSRRQLQAEVLKLEKVDQTEFIYVDIPPGAAVIGKEVGEVKLPKESLIVSIRRGREVYITHGYTALKENDRLTIFTSLECAPEVRRILTNTTIEDGECEEIHRQTAQ